MVFYGNYSLNKNHRNHPRDDKPTHALFTSKFPVRRAAG